MVQAVGVRKMYWLLLLGVGPFVLLSLFGVFKVLVIEGDLEFVSSSFGILFCIGIWFGVCPVCLEFEFDT